MSQLVINILSQDWKGKESLIPTISHPLLPPPKKEKEKTSSLHSYFMMNLLIFPDCPFPERA